MTNNQLLFVTYNSYENECENNCDHRITHSIMAKIIFKFINPIIEHSQRDNTKMLDNPNYSQRITTTVLLQITILFLKFSSNSVM